MNGKRLPDSILQGLAARETVICASAQRQASLRAAWAEAQRDAGLTQWATPSILTFTQFAERALSESWAAAGLPDQLLPPGAEWAALREWRRHAADASGGTAEARALLNAARTLTDWRIGRSPQALGGSPEGELLLEALARLDALRAHGRRPLREWLGELDVPPGPLLAAGTAGLAAASQDALRRWQVRPVEPVASPSAVRVACADDDDHELELIAAWCRRELEQDPDRRLLVVDARLRQRRGLYDRILSQSLSPSEWVSPMPRAQSAIFAIEGGRPLAEFPIIAHALLSLRLLTGRLRFDEVVHWLRLPFLDGVDHMAGAAVEEVLRQRRMLEWTGEELARELERLPAPVTAVIGARLRTALNTLAGERRIAAEWSPRLLLALRQLGWHGTRPLRSDEQQAVARWHALLDEFAALGAWLPRAGASEAVSTLADLASERNFDPASVSAPITLSDSHDDPVVRYDGIWVAGLDSTQWPPPPRPDVFIPLRLQVSAGIPWASALGQTEAARRSLAQWRAAADGLTVSWARLEGDAHRSISPLLAKLEPRTTETSQSMPTLPPLAMALRRTPLESVEDAQGTPVDTRRPVSGGVTPITLQSECGFHAYGQVRLAAEELEEPAPGLDARERGMLLHKALELVWIKLKDHFHLKESEGLRKPLIADSVEAAVAAVFRGYVPVELRLAVEREKYRLERLIESLLLAEQSRASFEVVALEARREVSIAGGRFDIRIDRIDSIEGGGHAILDYKSGEPRAPRWKGTSVRDPQLLTYLLAEFGRDVRALANVSLANGRARFSGRAATAKVLPGVKGLPGMDPNKVPSEDILAAWHAEYSQWLTGLVHVASDYIAGIAPTQPAADVCRNCHLTVLCRRIELAAIESDTEMEEGGHE